MNDVFQERLVFHGSDTDSVELTIMETDVNNTCHRGFIVPFSCKHFVCVII